MFLLQILLSLSICVTIPMYYRVVFQTMVSKNKGYLEYGDILLIAIFTELEKPSELKKLTELKETELIMPSEQAMLILPVVAHFRQVFSEPVQSPVVTLLQWRDTPVTNTGNPPVKHSSDQLQMNAPVSNTEGPPVKCSRFCLQWKSRFVSPVSN